MKKLSLVVNQDEKVMPFIDRFEKDESINRSMSAEMDFFTLAYVLNDGIRSVVKKLEYEEMMQLFGRFSTMLLTMAIEPSHLRAIFNDVTNEYNSEWLTVFPERNEVLMKKINNLTLLEMYSVIDFARRFRIVKVVNNDEKMNEIGLPRKAFQKNEEE